MRLAIPDLYTALGDVLVVNVVGTLLVAVEGVAVATVLAPAEVGTELDAS